MKTLHIALALLVAMVILSIKLVAGEIEVSGEIFIVTKGGTNFRLGDVEVHACDRDAVEKWAPVIIEKRKEISRKVFDALKKAMDDYDALKKSDSKGRAANSRHQNELMSVMENEGSIGALVKETPPPSITSARTNSDGKYTLFIDDAHTDVLLVVSASRKIVNGTEIYLWIEPVTKPRNGKSEVSFKNSNLIDDLTFGKKFGG